MTSGESARIRPERAQTQIGGISRQSTSATAIVTRSAKNVSLNTKCSIWMAYADSSEGIEASVAAHALNRNRRRSNAYTVAPQAKPMACWVSETTAVL